MFYTTPSTFTEHAFVQIGADSIPRGRDGSGYHESLSFVLLNVRVRE